MPVALAEVQRIPTSGARAVEPFTVDGVDLLAIPQLAVDVPGQAPGMNAGNSDTELQLLKRVDGRYEAFSTLAAPGGEDAEFFTIGPRCFLAVASIRSGSGPYHFAVDCPSVLYRWNGETFQPHQTLIERGGRTFATFRRGDAHYLAKLRTGGTTAAAFPDERELADLILACSSRAVPFKCTAGLHRAVRHDDDATGFAHHGYLNVLLAVDAAARGGTTTDVASLLAERSAGTVADAGRALGPPRLRVARARFGSFGTCSIVEPVDDLVALGLLVPPAPTPVPVP